MINTKKIIITLGIVSGISIGSLSAYAYSISSSKADTVAKLTNRSPQSVTQEHIDENKSYGLISKEAGKLDEFKKENLNFKEEQIDSKVKDGTLSKKEGDDLISKIKENMENCDGTNGPKERLGLGKYNSTSNRNGACLK